jgi:hypothetical protein
MNYFCYMIKVPLSGSECAEIEHRQGYGILHRGQQMHGALPIHSGERHNIIIWIRSSEIRNKCCPMCARKPNLVKVAGKSDGFTIPSVSICSTSWIWGLFIWGRVTGQGELLGWTSYLVRQIEAQNYGKLTISWDNSILPSYCALKTSKYVSVCWPR